jgi:alcohol dehydrogenase class IV
VEETFDASLVYIIASKSLSDNTDALKRLDAALGSKVVGTRVGMRPHTPWSDILSIVNEARPLNSDCIATLGAGSLTDGSKIIACALANDIRNEEDLSSLCAHGPT